MDGEKIIYGISQSCCQQSLGGAVPVVLEQVRRGNLSKTRLLDTTILFLEEKYPGGRYHSWSDLAAEHHTLGTISFLEGMPVCPWQTGGMSLYVWGRRVVYPCNVFRLCLVKDFWAILRQELCRKRLLETSEATLRHRIPKTLVHRSAPHIGEG